MPDRILSTGSTASAMAAFVFFSVSGAAEAARCPLGEIYRPSRGVCVSKEKAIHAGIYRASARVADAADPVQPPKADETPVPKPRPQALAAIERRAPIAQQKDQEALGFSAAPMPRSTQVAPVATVKPEPSPFGSLVALEPLP